MSMDGSAALGPAGDDEPNGEGGCGCASSELTEPADDDTRLFTPMSEHFFTGDCARRVALVQNGELPSLPLGCDESQ